MDSQVPADDKRKSSRQSKKIERYNADPMDPEGTLTETAMLERRKKQKRNRLSLVKNKQHTSDIASNKQPGKKEVTITSSLRRSRKIDLYDPDPMNPKGTVTESAGRERRQVREENRKSLGGRKKQQEPPAESFAAKRKTKTAVESPQPVAVAVAPPPPPVAEPTGSAYSSRPHKKIVPYNPDPMDPEGTLTETAMLERRKKQKKFRQSLSGRLQQQIVREDVGLESSSVKRKKQHSRRETITVMEKLELAAAPPSSDKIILPSYTSSRPHKKIVPYNPDPMDPEGTLTESAMMERRMKQKKNRYSIKSKSQQEKKKALPGLTTVEQTEAGETKTEDEAHGNLVRNRNGKSTSRKMLQNISTTNGSIANKRKVANASSAKSMSASPTSRARKISLKRQRVVGSGLVSEDEEDNRPAASGLTSAFRLNGDNSLSASSEDTSGNGMEVNATTSGDNAGNPMLGLDENSVCRRKEKGVRGKQKSAVVKLKNPVVKRPRSRRLLNGTTKSRYGRRSEEMEEDDGFIETPEETILASTSIQTSIAPIRNEVVSNSKMADPKPMVSKPFRKEVAPECAMWLLEFATSRQPAPCPDSVVPVPTNDCLEPNSVSLGSTYDSVDRAFQKMASMSPNSTNGSAGSKPAPSASPGNGSISDEPPDLVPLEPFFAPSPPPTIPDTVGKNRWSYNSKERTLRGDFRDTDKISVNEKTFIAQMMERSDISLILRGMTGRPAKVPLQEIHSCFGDKPYHKFRRFNRVIDSTGIASYRATAGFVGMLISDFIRYLELHEQAIKANTKESFIFLDQRNPKKNSVTVEDVRDAVFYFLDCDMPKHLPWMNEQYR